MGNSISEEYEIVPESQETLDSLYIDIFALGNYQMEYLNKLVNTSLEVHTTNDCQNISYTYYIHPVLKWKIYLASVENDVNKNYEHLKKYISQAYINKRRNNVVVYFADSIGESETQIFKEFSSEKALEPCIIFMTKETESLQKQLEDYDYSQRVTVLEYKEDDLTNLNEELLKCSFYLNQIGDNVEFPPNLNEVLEIKNMQEQMLKKTNQNNGFLAAFNIMLIGQPGVGKSSFVNYILGEKKARESLGIPMTKNLIRYVHKKYPIAIYDTPGFEDSEKTKEITKKIIACNAQLKENKEQINIIFFLLNGSLKRTFVSYEKEFLKVLIKLGVEIYFLINLSKNEEEAKEFQEILELDVEQLLYDEQSNLSYKIFPINFRKGKICSEKFGLENLFESLYKNYEKDKIDISKIQRINQKDNQSLIDAISKSRFTNQIQDMNDIFKKLRKEAICIISGAVLLSGAAAASPIPYTDYAIIAGAEMAEVGSLILLYKVDRNKEQVLKGLGIGAGVSGSSLGIISSLKFIPGIGTIVGGIAMACISAGTCVSIGAACIKMFEDDLKKEGMKNHIIEIANCYNQAIEFFKINYEKEKKNGS